MSNFNLIVHIGTGKTGSSSIQESLRLSPQKLKEKGTAYLGLLCEHTERKFPWQRAGGWLQLSSLKLATAQEQLYEVLLAAIHQLDLEGYEKAIWSNETIFGNHGLVLPVLERLASTGVKIDVIVYIRRHDAWARSAYLQWGIKHKGYSGPLQTFKEWFEGRSISFSSGLGPWLDLSWLNIAVKNFDAVGDVVQDFLDTCELSQARIKSIRINETPHATILALFALYNSQLDEAELSVNLKQILMSSGLLNTKIIDCDFESLLPTKNDIEFVNKKCSNDRKKVNDIFRRFDQPEILTSPLADKRIQVSPNQINSALLLILKKQHERIVGLSRRLKNIEDVISNMDNKASQSCNR